ncbi:MAG: endonuclease domain-containing protein [Dehalococcoidales bacterium]
MGDNPITEAARELRKRQTEAEKRLWCRLRDNQIRGAKFRRQEPLGTYIVDFVCFEKKLVIEVDGNPHKETENKANDKQRTLWLQDEGFRVLRFWNSEIVDNIERVLVKIENNLA